MEIIITPAVRIPLTDSDPRRRTPDLPLTKKDFHIRATSSPGRELVLRQVFHKDLVLDDDGGLVERVFIPRLRNLEEVADMCLDMVLETERVRMLLNSDLEGVAFTFTSTSVHFVNEGRFFMVALGEHNLYNELKQMFQNYLVAFAHCAGDPATNLEYRFLLGASHPTSLAISIWNYDMLLGARACRAVVAVILKRFAKYSMGRDPLQFLARSIWNTRASREWARTTETEEVPSKRQRPEDK